MKQVCFNVERILNNYDPNIVHIGYLDSANSNLVNYVIPYLHNFRNDRNISYLHSVNNQLDSLLPTISNLLIQELPSNTDGIRESITSFRRSISQRLRHTEEEFNRIESVGEKLSKDLVKYLQLWKFKSRLDIAISEFQQQFSQAEDTRRQQFSNGEEERRKEHEKHEERWSGKFGELAEDSEEKFEI